MSAIIPELSVVRWFNSPAQLTLEALRGKVVVLHAFQMLCPGCVAHGTPQAEKLHRLFAGNSDIAVIGLHTVFEHHAAMTEVALEAFIHEYRLSLPIGVDQPGIGTPIPVTMQRFGMRGTPTTIVIDRDGTLVQQGFGQVDDLGLGVLIGSLLARPASADHDASLPTDCDEGGCQVPSQPKS